MHQVLYLNNYGSRWIFKDPSLMRVILETPDGERKVRRVEYWMSLGNFAACTVRWRRRRIQFLPIERDKGTGYPVCQLTNERWASILG